ncbi:hypothetical protein F5Y12DRAFT_721424 [Xylaria sp. FL1777]|nr:hypothetical protein F5Y12DRAFT_721424 [Xylaria sp. FL1777]
MAYYTSIFQDAHKDPTTRNAIPQPTHSSVAPYYAQTPYASIPLSCTPSSRPFRAFANSPPTPPPRGFSVLSTAEGTRTATNEALAARQRDLYAMPGADIQLREVGDRGAESSLTEDVVSVVRGLKTALVAATEAIRAEVKRARAVYAARWTRFVFWVSALNYRLMQSRRTAVIELRGFMARVRPVLFAALFLFVLGMVVAADLFDDADGELVYLLVEEYNSWCVVA